MNTYLKIRKYLFILSLFFSLVITIHFILIYLYEDSKISPEKGGIISVGFIGNPPSLNPFEFGLDQTNDYILQFLYRSLLKYDIVNKKMSGDIVNCDLGESFSNIKCFVKNDGLWNDGSPITKDDILKTYDFLKKSDTNKTIKKLLENIDILDKGEYIEFNSKNPDALILDAFMIPIIKKGQIEQIETNSGKIDLPLISSGPYNFTKKELDTKYDIQKITITNNVTSNSKDIYIGKYVFKFFNDKNTLLKNEDSLNIIFPLEGQNFVVSPRFKIYNYILPQYIGLFLNYEKIINSDLRKAILFQLGNNPLSELKKSSGKIINNPFFGNELITPTLTNKDIASIINTLGFFKKDYLLGEIDKKYNDLLAPKKGSGEIPYSVYFKVPTNRSIYFYSGSAEILLSGNVPSGTQKVFINEYQLKSFVPGNTRFYFRAKGEFKTLLQGKNIYNLYVEINGKKIKKDALTIYYYTSKDELAKKENEIRSIYLKNKTLTPEEIINLKQDKNLEIQKIQNLDNVYYYDKNYNKFSLTLEYTNEGQFFNYIANTIKDELKLIGINILIKEIDKKRMEDIISKGDKNYDMILTGINNGLFVYNISSFFHSGQAKTGFNLSKIKNLQLDLILENLKSKEFSEDKLQEIEKDALNIIRNEAILKTFYSPYISFYIDQNIKNVLTVDLVPYKYYTYDIIKNSYIKEERIINYLGKNLGGFLEWIKNHYLNFK